MKTIAIFACSTALMGATLLNPQSCRADEFAVSDGWTIEITPTEKLSSDDVSSPSGDATATETVDVANYRRIYRTIPFSRAEYNGNPTYRHDSTMEILTGHARHKTIVRHDSSVKTNPVSQPQAPVVPYRFNNRRWGLNYSFYFPYWNYRGLY